MQFLKESVQLSLKLLVGNLIISAVVGTVGLIALLVIGQLVK